ncbi:MAG TPA: bifunctional oligoribonuclease/PAP phosphatase NrnA [Fimbriimonadales bacterium]|nr:bifunctional oligoribonuclease/PAP phosphatase NrnA [Fimbriimonadales bacterium]
MTHVPKEEALRLQKLFESASSILLASHMSPDGDSIASALALGEILESKNKNVVYVCHDPVPKNLHFLSRWEKFIIGEDALNRFGNTVFDLAVVVDLNVLSRLGSVRPLVEQAKNFAIIDHHPITYETPPGIQLISPKYAATALMIYELLLELQYKITTTAAQCILTGIVTDTGNFRHGNTTPDCLRAAANLMELGANLPLISLEIWGKKPKQALDLLGRALSRITLLKNGRLAYSWINLQDYSEIGCPDEYSEDIVNHIGTVENAQVYLLFREPKPGRIRVSVRSRGDIDVADVCRRFDGGGHKNAAGCTLYTTMEDAIQRIIPALSSLLPE